MTSSIKTSTAYTTTDGVSHPAPGIALQHQMWLDVRAAVAAAQTEEIVETGTFLEDDRGNPSLLEDHLPTFVADNSHLLLGILMKAFSAKSDNAEALGVDGARQQAPTKWLILEVGGPFDQNNATVYDAANMGDEQIFKKIASLENSIKVWGAIENKPKKLDAMIEQTKADIKALVAYVDGR